MSWNSENKLKAFSLIEFLEDGGVTVVPTHWLSGDKTLCKFPSPVPKNFDKVSEVANSPVESSWIDYPIKFIKSYDTYKKAAKKANQYVDNKPIDSSECEGQRRRPRKQTEDKSTTSNEILPPTGSLEGSQENNSEENLQSSESIILSVSEIAAPSDLPQFQFVQISDPRIDTLLTEFRNFQKESLKNQETLLERISGLEKIVQNSLRTSSQSQPVAQLWSWPVKTEDELRAAEIWLQNKSNYLNEVATLSRIGGTSETKVIYNTLHWIISEDLAALIRYTDNSGKIPFRNTLSAQLIRDSVRAGNPDYKITEKKLNDHIAAWFRQSTEREKSRNKKKTNVADNTTSPHTAEGERSPSEDPTSNNPDPAADG